MIWAMFEHNIAANNNQFIDDLNGIICTVYRLLVFLV